MAIIETKDGSIELADSLVAAVVRNAEFTGSLTVRVLNQLVPDELRGTVRWPAGFLLEFGSVLQIGYWESQGISAHIEARLPSYADASRQLADRARKGPAEFTGDDTAPLHKAVVRFWIDKFAWEGQTLLQTDVVVGDVDEDRFLDLAAEFCWQHRHELRDLLTKGEDGDGE